VVLIDEVIGARTGSVLVSYLADSGGEYLVNERGQVIDLNFVAPYRPGAGEVGVPEAELIPGRRDTKGPGSERG
jgi:hypothetical protein